VFSAPVAVGDESLDVSRDAFLGDDQFYGGTT
jgi:hypothetical protein